MAIQLFIGASYIKEFAFVDQNVDEKYIKISIEEAQTVHIREYTGSDLYNEIVSQLSNNTLTTLNRTLLETYIQPALKWWTMYEAAPFLTYKVTNKNIVRKNSDNSSGIDYNELDQFMNMITDKAQYYTNRLVLYLCENSTSYPLYENYGSGIDVIPPRKNAFDCGIFLGNTKNKPTSYEERFER